MTRAAVDKGKRHGRRKKRSAKKTGKKVTVVGAGPAGLTGPYYLVTKGHEVTLFYSFPKSAA